MPYYERKYPKKFPYPAGMLSMGLLLLFSAFMIMPKVDERALDIVEYNPRWEDINNNMHGVIKRRNYLDITLTGDESEDYYKLASSALVLYKQRQVHDTINGVHIHINNSANYKTFVNALTVVKYTRIDTTSINMVYNNDIWAFSYIPEQIKETATNFGYGLGQCCIITEDKEALLKAQRESEKQNFNAAIAHFYPLIALWVLVLITALYNTIKANTPHHRSYLYQRR